MKTLVSVIALTLVFAWPSVGEAQSKKSTARMAFQTWIVKATCCLCAAWPKSWIESPIANISIDRTTAPIRASVAQRACMLGEKRACEL